MTAVQGVRLRDCAWSCGNRHGNRRGIHAGLAGAGRLTAEQWLDYRGQMMLDRTAQLAARDVRRYNIPLRWCTVDDLTALRPGLTTHRELSMVFGGPLRVDPGPGFPREHLLELIQSNLRELALVSPE